MFAAVGAAAALASAQPALAQAAPAPAPASVAPAAPAAHLDSVAEPMPDPLSGPNHAFFHATRSVDKAVIAPAFRAYNHVVPSPIRTGLDNAIQNLDEPRNFANNLLQGRFKGAGRSAARFVINSTVGVAGLFDPATKSGIERQEADFGQTLGRYGVKSGPYIFVPLAGPSSLRDGFGRLVDIFADPVALLAGGLGTVFGDVRAGVATVDERADVGDQLQLLDKQFTDPYATVKSAYSQQRASAIAAARGQTQSDVDQLPDFGPSPAPGQTQAAPQKPVGVDTDSPRQSQ